MVPPGLHRGSGLDSRASSTTIRAVLRPRTVSLALVPLVLHALAREADRALGLVLRAEIEPDGLLVEVVRAVAADGPAAAWRVAGWLAAGLALVSALAWRRARASDANLDAAFEQEARVFAPLLLRPALTLLALACVALWPSYPYAFTLPVALTQDWSMAQDLLALAAILALGLPAPRLPAPRAGEVFLLSFLAYAALVPPWAWHWDSHPGNEPKTLRQAVALGHWLAFDAEAVTGPMEELEARPLTASLKAAASLFGPRSSACSRSATARGSRQGTPCGIAACCSWPRAWRGFPTPSRRSCSSCSAARTRRPWSSRGCAIGRASTWKGWRR